MPMVRLLFVAVILATVLFSTPAQAAGDPPRVLVTIKPVHALVAAVMEGIGVPDLLIEGAVSPHTLTLRPSDARKIAEADLVVWVGPELETVLTDKLPALAPRAHRLTLMDAPDVRLLENANNQIARDPHIWLDPDNARAIARAAARVLGDLDPDNAGRYRANADALEARLLALGQTIRARLIPVMATPFAVYHDAFGYLERAFDLTNVGYVVISPDRMAGVAHVGDLRAALRDQGVRCLFTEPQFTPALADALVRGLPVRIATLDPLGAALAPGPGLYEQLIKQNAESLLFCLGG